MKMKKLSLTTCFFLLTLAVGLCLSFGTALTTAAGLLKNFRNFGVTGAVRVMERTVDEVYSRREDCLAAFGLTQRLLGKKEARNFEVLKSDDGQLYLSAADFPEDEETIRLCAEQIAVLCAETEAYGGRFLFVQVPYKNAGMASDLQDYTDDRTEEAEDLLLELLRESRVPTLDLRQDAACSRFYRTDHHWTVEASYAAACDLAAALLPDSGQRERLADPGQYEARCWPDSFLGSIGIKVGPYYTGKDDFTVLIPTFQTDFSFTILHDGEVVHHSEGPFFDSLVQRELLDDSRYLNKYASMLFGNTAGYEYILDNRLAGGDDRVLCITHSYGRSMCAYLSLFSRQTTMLDPQPGRYEESFLRYIRDHQPDYVVFAYNDLVSIAE